MLFLCICHGSDTDDITGASPNLTRHGVYRDGRAAYNSRSGSKSAAVAAVIAITDTVMVVVQQLVAAML